MVESTIGVFEALAVKKRDFALRYPVRYFILSMMAGIYVGFGIILIFSIGAPLKSMDAAILKTVMGASFGVALTLVIFAGSELFTGNNMILTIGSLSKKVSWRNTVWLWVLCLIGNFIGSVLLGWIFVASGLGTNEITAKFLAGVAKAKAAAPFAELFFRGVLCNMLVCLAVWTSNRATSDSAKLILIFWCLFAFIGSGFEHSIANMTIYGAVLFMPGLSMAETAREMMANLVPVILGNMVGGAVFIGAAYWYVASGLKATPVTSTEREPLHGKITADK